MGHGSPPGLSSPRLLFILDRLLEEGSLTQADHRALSEGYRFVSTLDHSIRLVTGRSRQLPRDAEALKTIAARSSIADLESLLETLSVHRLNIRGAFEHVLEITRD